MEHGGAGFRVLKAVGIGAGYFSRFHYEAWSRIPEVAMVAACDVAEEKARAAGTLRSYTDWREMVERERPDFVDVITPPGTHEEICGYLGERGIHVICQKPLAPTLEAAERMVAAARRAGIRFMVHENWRWQPWYRKLREIRESGEIGEFTHFAFRMRTGDGWGERAYLDRQPFFRDYPRLLVFETGVHFVDTFRYLLGEVTEVFANLRRLNPVIAGEETGQVFFRFVSGATAIWDANRYNEVESATPRFTFGDFRVDAMGGHVTMDTEARLRMKKLGIPGEDVAYRCENVNFAGDCVYATQRHFVEGLLTGADFETSGEEYLKTLRVVEAIYASAASGQLVKVL